jgi:hypothetical protein
MEGLREAVQAKTNHRTRKNRHRASILLSKDGFSRGKNSKAMEEKLGDQFRYFRQEFLDGALSIGVPVPLDMVEDKGGRVFTFVNQKGPRYLFQIMHSNPESAHLLRVSLSLLIVTISILRGKLPQTTVNSNDQKSAHAWVSLLSENVSSWALDSLTTIADGSAVAICTNLLRHSHSQTIQELILNLLAQLVNITEEAANQMLLYPTITSHEQTQKETHGKDEDLRGATPMLGRSLVQQDSGSPTSQLRQKRLSHVPVNSNTTHNSGSSGSNNNNNGATGVKGTSKGRAGGGGGHEGEDNYTCLSYMFSVVAHHRNRYTVMTACAEVVLALVANKSPLICEEIARTCISPAAVDTSGKTQGVASNSRQVNQRRLDESEKGKQ